MPHLLFHNYITAGLRFFFPFVFWKNVFLYTLPTKLSLDFLTTQRVRRAGKKKRRAKSDSLTKEPGAVVAVFPAGTSSPVDELKVRNNEREGMTCQHNASIVGTTKAAAEQQG